MGYRTLSGSRKHPELNSIPDKRGVRVFKLWQKWLDYYLEKNASRIEDLISSQKDLMTSDLDSLKKLQNIIKIEVPPIINGITLISNCHIISKK